jgi:hypothetical protein
MGKREGEKVLVSTSISLALSSQRQSLINFLLKVENKDVSRCWSSRIVESCLESASSEISVNSKELRNG